MEKKKINKSLINIIIILAVALFLSIPLFYSKLNVYMDDGIQHIARAFGTSKSIKDNWIAPNIISSFANGFGYSWNLFYGPLSTYGVILFALVVKNYIVAYKCFAGLCIFLSGLFMFKFVKTLTKIDNIGVLAAVLYMSFPYHLTDLYTRNALGEFVSFVFIPIVFLGVYNIFYNESGNKYYLAIGVIGLILTHNLSTIIVVFFAVIYAITKFERITEKEIQKAIIINIVFIILITSFYWLPLLETKIKADYQVYEDGMMATPESVSSHGLKFMQLFLTKNDGSFAFELGLNVLIMLVFTFVSLKIIYKPLKEHYIFFLIAGIVSMWMATKYFPWKYLPKELSYIQFPWRMMMMTSFFLSIVCAINMYLIIIKFNVKDVVVITIISMFCTFLIFDTFIMGDLGISDIENIVLGRFSGTEHETVAGTGKGEYLPTAVYKDKFYLATREDTTFTLEGKAIIENENKEGSSYSAMIQTFDADYTTFELPFIYYPGYVIRCDGIIVPNYETENGFLGFVMGKNDKALVEVKYEGTSLMKKSIVISIISLITFIIINVKEFKILKTAKKQGIIEKVENKNMEEGNG